MIRRIGGVTMLVLALSASPAGADDAQHLRPYVEALETKGKDPLEFVLDVLTTHDLVLFDDALHTAVEPFEFYGRLIHDSRFRARYVFLEAVPINQQPAIDAYLDAEVEDRTLLYPAFQNDYSGFGWRYQTYFDLLGAIREANLSRKAEDRIRVVAVNAPVYWEEIDSPEDVDLFRLSLAGNDYTMYKVILHYLDDFRSGKKGIFLTNTRHAYKGIRNAEDRYYWNCGTFFAQEHPGKTYSVRIHNITLKLEGERASDPGRPKTTEGAENLVIRWIRMEDGLWDSAFRKLSDKPIALDIGGTPFGEAPYVGNHMLDAAPGQAMSDAYDGLISLAPVETMRQTAMVSFLYTEEFKRELERRMDVLYTQTQIAEALHQKGVKTKREFIDQDLDYEPETVQPLAASIGPIDAWAKPAR